MIGYNKVMNSLLQLLNADLIWSKKFWCRIWGNCFVNAVAQKLYGDPNLFDCTQAILELVELCE